MRTMFGTAMLLALAAPAIANDTTAELTTGGLIYVQTADIAMAEENLYISRDEVLVDYVFRNGGDKDVESVIAFPQLQQRVTALGIDRTDELVARKVPLLPYSDRTAEALKALPEDVKAAWIAEGLVQVDSYDAGQGWQQDLRPAWTLSSAYWWKTRFPAGKPVKVSHRYKPSVGGTVAMSFIENGKPAYSHAEYAERYCIDDAFMRTAAKLEAASAKSAGPHYTEQWVSYILTTGANWAGPIGRFKLTIDKGSQKDFVSFCGEGVKKVGPTTFEMTKTDFTPEKDLHVLFLTAAQ